MEELKEEVSKMLTDYMEKHNLDLDDLSAETDIPKGTLYNWVNKIAAPRPADVTLLEDTFGVEFGNKLEYILYKGDDFIAIGTLEEIVEETGLNYYTLMSYKTPSKRKRHRGYGYSVTPLRKD